MEQRWSVSSLQSCVKGLYGVLETYHKLESKSSWDLPFAAALASQVSQNYVALEVGQLRQAPDHGAAGEVHGISLNTTLESLGAVGRSVDRGGEEDTRQDPVVC